MNRILRMRRRVECGFYDDPGLIDAKLNGAGRQAFLTRLGIDDPDVVHPQARNAASVTIVLALVCGGGVLAAGMGLLVWQIAAWLRGA